MQFDINTYRAQRQVRQKRRHDLIRRFQIVRSRHQIQSHHHHPPIVQLEAPKHIEHHIPKQHIIPVVENNYQQQCRSLQAENERLRHQLQQAEQSSQENMKSIKQEISTLKTSYQTEMDKITHISENEKKTNENKLKTLLKQIKDAQAKNEEIEQTNAALAQEAASSEELFQKCLKQIEVEYQQKLAEFEVIMKESKSKIDEMEKNFNEQQMVENALKNEKLIEALIRNSKIPIKTSKQDYENVLNNKVEMIERLIKNSKQKEEQIKKIKELTDRFKHVFETLNAEKRQLMQENQKMTQELIQIKKIFAAALGQPEEQIEEGEQGEQEQQQDQDDEDAQEDQQA